MIWSIFLSLAIAVSQANAPKASLSIEAALIYRSGDVKPVARVQFLVLDESLATILSNSGITQPQDISIITTDKNMQLVITYAKAMLGAPGHERFLAQAEAAIKPHIVAAETTGFDGKAEINNAPAKPCYIVAVSRAGQSWLVWNLKAELKPGKNKILFDQNNAAFVR